MRRLLLILAACSSKTDDKAKPVEPPPKMPSVSVRAVCPTGILTTHPWAHEVFPACPPPQHWTDGIRCEGPCPKPCRITSQMHDLPPHTHELVYDTAGRWIGDEAKGEIKKACEYDDQGRMTRCRDYEGDFRIERDERGRIARVDGPDGVTNRFEYDERGRVIETYELLLQTSKLEYDNAGWLLREHRSGLFVDHDQVVTYHYDEHGRVTHHETKDLPHPRSTREPMTFVERFSYDANGRLAEASGGGVRERYTYDAKGRAIRYVRENVDEKSTSQTETIEYCD